MPSIIEKHIQDREAFLARYRRAYLASVCAEMGIQTDLRRVAMIEARAMIEIAESLLPKDRY
jgi:hypothetical protein